MHQLNRSPEMDDDRLPIVSLAIVADKNRCPPNFVPITKTHDDGSDADLWKDGFGFGLFNRSVRYLAISRHISDTHGPMEVLTDLAVISDKEAIPSSFICLDFTIDSKERALKKKYLCARFTPRNDALDAVSNIIILAKQKRPPKNYSQAGEIDGMLVCFKVITIPERYGCLTHSQSSGMEVSNTSGGSSLPGLGPSAQHLYPNVNRHSTSELDRMGTSDKSPQAAHQGLFIKGIDRVPFVLNPMFAVALSGKNMLSSLPPIPDWRTLEAKYAGYNCRLERSIASPPVTPTSPPAEAPPHY